MNSGRRLWLRMMLLGGAAMGAVPPRPASADRIRVLGAPGAEAVELGATLARGGGDLRRFLGEVRIGEARSAGALRVFWLQGAAGAPLAVLTLDEARAAETLAVSERGQGTVPELVVENRGKTPVLLLAGEILLGGKQNRVLTTDILLPGLSGPVAIGVYCVEQGRWAAGASMRLSSGGTLAAPGLRAKVMARAPQSSIWAEVDRYSNLAQAASPTRNYQQIYDQKEIKDHQADVERRIERRPPAGTLGAAVCVADRVVGLDLFFDPDLFARQWPKLLRAQALDSYRGSDAQGVDERALRERVAVVLKASALADGWTRPTAGAGELIEFRADARRGAALVHEGRVMHLAVL